MKFNFFPPFALVRLGSLSGVTLSRVVGLVLGLLRVRAATRAGAFPVRVRCELARKAPLLLQREPGMHESARDSFDALPG